MSHTTYHSPSGRPNRVAPDGSTHAVADRGLFWGNRGQLLNSHGELVRHARGSNWIICRLEFMGRQRMQWRPDRLTELYFLDEPTALASGHRPCGKCRYHDYQRFKHAWERAHPHEPHGARNIDRRLHDDRLAINGPDRSRHRAHDGELATVPDGAMIEDDHGFWLVRGESLHAWDHAGYGEARTRTRFPDVVTVATPRSTVATLRAGYQPAHHPSALAAGKESS